MAKNKAIKKRRYNLMTHYWAVSTMEQLSNGVKLYPALNEKERTHAQTSLLRAVSYLWCRDQEELCAAFRYSALETSRRPEVCRY